MPSSCFKSPASTEIYTLSLHDALRSQYGLYRLFCHFFSLKTPRHLQRRRHDAGRSEEHTSELQSLRPLVCRLLVLSLRPPPRSTLFPYTTLSDLNTAFIVCFAIFFP